MKLVSVAIQIFFFYYFFFPPSFTKKPAQAAGETLHLQCLAFSYFSLSITQPVARTKYPWPTKPFLADCLPPARSRVGAHRWAQARAAAPTPLSAFANICAYLAPCACWSPGHTAAAIGSRALAGVTPIISHASAPTDARRRVTTPRRALCQRRRVWGRCARAQVSPA